MPSDPCFSCGGPVRPSANPARYSRPGHTVSRTTDGRRRAKRRARRAAR